VGAPGSFFTIRRAVWDPLVFERSARRAAAADSDHQDRKVRVLPMRGVGASAASVLRLPGLGRLRVSVRLKPPNPLARRGIDLISGAGGASV
jgi:hypothetical protein